MRARFALFFTLLGMASSLWPLHALAQSERDFVFMDEFGHLVVRFAGTAETGLEPSHLYEISNAEFSSMVHDRLHADLQFSGEPLDPEWAAVMEPRIEHHIGQADQEFSAVFTECRASSCRIIMEQLQDYDVPEHQLVLGQMQASLEAFIAAHPHEFQRVFMITAYDQEFETSHIKAFLRRTGYTPPEVPHD